MKILPFSIFVFFVLFSSCKEDKKNVAESVAAEQNTTTTSSPEASKIINTNDVPDPASLVSGEFIKGLFKMSSVGEVRPGSSPDAKDKSTFYRIEDPKANGAILIQIAVNPIPAEIENYPSTMIDNKMTVGEADPVSNESSKYISLPELGDKGCYNYSLGKYHWKLNEDYLYMIAFNTSHKEADQKKLAIAIAQELNKNISSSK